MERHVQSISIFDFKKPSLYFSAKIEYKKLKNPLFSLRAAAKQIGIAPSTLSFFINGKKKLTIDTARKISHWLKLNAKEEDYFLKLIELESCTDESVKLKLNLSIADLQVVQTHSNKLLDYKVLDDWCSVVLMAIFMSPELRKKDLREISDILKEPYEKIKSAHSYLLENGFSIPAEDFHKMMLNKAAIVIDEQTNNEKYVGSETFEFDESHLKKAKELINEFMSKMVDLNQKSQQNKIYHLEVQLLKLTK